MDEEKFYQDRGRRILNANPDEIRLDILTAAANGNKIETGKEALSREEMLEKEWVSKYDLKTGRLKENEVLTYECYEFIRNHKNTDDILKKYMILKEEPNIKKDSRVKIRLPFDADKLDSEFAREVSEVLKDKYELFYRAETKDIIEIVEIKDKLKNNSMTVFVPVTPGRFITYIEKHIIPYQEKTERGMTIKMRKSIGGPLAHILLQSKILQDSLPRIERIFSVPIPIIYENALTFPKRGYDERFNSWLPFDAPDINPHMKLEEAKEIIDNIFKEFCFRDEQSKANAIALMLTPFLKGLYPQFNTRTPIGFYLANRERAGKDYCAGITGILYEGYAIEEPPISNNENSKGGSSEELRKKITSTLVYGRNRYHSANNKGRIDNAVLEMVATVEKYSDRMLGRNEMIALDNELTISLSGNVGITFTPDLANRCIFVYLFLEMEDANSRKFNNPVLHNWVKENRGKILSALYSLVFNWVQSGKPNGSKQFASYPIWAEVCGGIMESAGFVNPCNPDKEVLNLGGDTETQDMKRLFEVCFQKRGEIRLTRADIKTLIREEDLFPYWDLENSRADQTKFGNRLIKFNGRILSGIKLNIINPKERGGRQEAIFKRLNSGDLGDIGYQDNLDRIRDFPIYNSHTMVAKVAEVTNLEDSKIPIGPITPFKSLIGPISSLIDPTAPTCAVCRRQGSLTSDGETFLCNDCANLRGIR